MKAEPTKIPGVLVLEPEPLGDQRGFFARTWDRAVLETLGATVEVEQTSVAFNERRGTLRGMHFQIAPHQEAKTIRCTAGAIFDVALDLRAESPTFRSWVGVELTSTNRRSLFVPEGCAHGYVSLADATEVTYQISVPHSPDSARGYRWDDPAFGISWPIPIECVSNRDTGWPPFLEGAR